MITPTPHVGEREQGRVAVGLVRTTSGRVSYDPASSTDTWKTNWPLKGTPAHDVKYAPWLTYTSYQLYESCT